MKNIIKIQIIHIFIAIIAIQTCNANNKKRYGMCIIPVADLINQSIKNIYPELSIEYGYKNLPKIVHNSSTSWHRNAQILLHDIVEIIHQTKEEYIIKVTHLPHYNNQKKITDYYYTNKNYIIPIAHMDQTEKNNIPQYEKHNQKNIISLILPWKSQELNIIYSAGTQFTVHKYDNHHYYVHTYSSKDKKFTIIKISKKYCLLHKLRTNAKKRKLFVALINIWSNNPQGKIPYLSGGCSITQFIPQNNIENYINQNTKDIKTGLDCSRLIALAARIIDIPLPGINSTALYYGLKKITSFELIESGDILYWHGHVTVINNIKNNTIIESRGIGHGYGYVHELKIDQELLSINSINILYKKYIQQLPIQRINKNKSIIKTIEKITLLKLI